MIEAQMTADLSQEQLDALMALKAKLDRMPFTEKYKNELSLFQRELFRAAPSLIAMAGRMLEATQRAEQFQRERAALSDKLNGTPCAEIRWGQEKEALQADLAAARERIAELEGELQSYKTLADQQLMHLARGNRRIKALDKALTMAMDDVPGWYDMARAARILTQGKAETAE